MNQIALQALQEFGVALNKQQIEAFRLYAAELAAWNEHTNLTAITDPDVVEMRHFVDSLSIFKIMKPRKGLRVIDVGTGAGFPGLPLKIAYPEMKVSLVEATGKKINFLKHMVDLLGFTDVELINARAEDIGQKPEHREKYDWVLARAVAGMRVLAEYLLPLADKGGHVIAQKGESAPQEATDAEEAIKLLGGRIVQLSAVELPTVADTHYLIHIEKIARTPALYPRRAGLPSKKPL